MVHAFTKVAKQAVRVLPGLEPSDVGGSGSRPSIVPPSSESVSAAREPTRLAARTGGIVQRARGGDDESPGTSPHAALLES